MKIQIMSDLHLDSSKCIIDVEEADIVLILGDTTYQDENWYWLFDRLNGKKTIIIPGNHEYDGHDILTRDTEIINITKEYNNIYYLNNKSIILDNVKFIGSCLWTDFNNESKINQEEVLKWAETIGHIKTIKKGNQILSIKDIIELNKKSVEYLEFELLKNRVNLPTFVLTHFAPSNKSISKEFEHSINSYHVMNLERLMGFSDYWLHGHVHNSINYELNDTIVKTNARGNSYTYDLSQNINFQKKDIIEINNQLNLKKKIR